MTLGLTLPTPGNIDVIQVHQVTPAVGVHLCHSPEQVDKFPSGTYKGPVCLTMDRPGVGPAQGGLSACRSFQENPGSEENTVTAGTAASMEKLWAVTRHAIHARNPLVACDLQTVSDRL